MAPHPLLNAPRCSPSSPPAIISPSDLHAMSALLSSLAPSSPLLANNNDCDIKTMAGLEHGACALEQKKKERRRSRSCNSVSRLSPIESKPPTPSDNLPDLGRSFFDFETPVVRSRLPSPEPRQTRELCAPTMAHSSSAPAFYSAPAATRSLPCLQSPIKSMFDADVALEHQAILAEGLAIAAGTKTSPRHQTFYHAMLELVDNEAAYLRDLSSLVNVYFALLYYINTMDDDTRQTIIRNATTMLQLHERINQRIMEIEQASHWKILGLIDNDILAEAARAVAQVFLQEEESLAEVYNHFCSRHSEAAFHITRLASGKTEWDAYRTQCKLQLVVHRSSEDPACRLELSDFLMKPIQRVTRYPLLFQSLVKHSKEIINLQCTQDIECTVNMFRSIATKIDLATHQRDVQVKSYLMSSSKRLPSLSYHRRPHSFHIGSHKSFFDAQPLKRLSPLDIGRNTTSLIRRSSTSASLTSLTTPVEDSPITSSVESLPRSWTKRWNRRRARSLHLTSPQEDIDDVCLAAVSMESDRAASVERNASTSSSSTISSTESSAAITPASSLSASPLVTPTEIADLPRANHWYESLGSRRKRSPRRLNSAPQPYIPEGLQLQQAQEAAEYLYGSVHIQKAEEQSGEGPTIRRRKASNSLFSFFKIAMLSTESVDAIKEIEEPVRSPPTLSTESLLTIPGTPSDHINESSFTITPQRRNTTTFRRLTKMTPMNRR